MTVESHRNRPATVPGATFDVATTLESLLPADLLAEADPALWGRTVVQVAQGLATHPADVGRVVAAHAALTARIGTAAVARALGSTAEGPVPVEKDGRFRDTTWEENPVYWGLRQEYLALVATLHDLVDAADLDDSSRERAGLLADVLGSVLSPTNLLPGNPAALKRAFETGGSSVLAGFRQMLDDLATNQGRPQQVDRTNLRVGQELAATPGKVVYRNRLMELIQFEPQTDEVHEIPILVSPPWINKYYVMDLAPGRSFLEWAVQHGHTVFVISYRDPDESMADTGLDDYLELGDLAAMDVVQEITGADKVNLVGLCLGGLMATIATAMLHSRGPGRPRQLADAAEHPARLLRPRARRELRRPGDRRAARAQDGEDRLPAGRLDGRHLRPAARQRPDLQLRRAELAGGQDAAGVRHPRVEQRLHAHAGQDARLLPAALLPGERAGARRARAARRAPVAEVGHATTRSSWGP